MPIRITGMNSGLDTESIISELVKAKSAKKDSLVKAQTKLQWKQDAWKELNSKVYALYSKTLSNMRIKSDYSKKTTTVSNSSAATVITGTKAVNGVQTLDITKVAKTGYLTGAALEKAGEGKYQADSKLVDIVGKDENARQIQVTVNNKTTNITIDEKITIGDFVKKLQDAGLNANFDETHQRFFISAKESGAAGDFALTANNEKGYNALKSLGLTTSLDTDTATKALYEKYCYEIKDGNGKGSGKYAVYQGQDWEEIVNKEIDSRLSQYKENVQKLEKVTKDYDELVSKYKEKYSVTEVEDQKKLEDELAEKEKKLKKDTKLTSDERKKLEKEIETLKAKVEDRKAISELEAKKTELEDAVKQDADYFVKDPADDNKYIIKSEKKDALKGEIRAKAELAVRVLNGEFATSGEAAATRVAGQDAEIQLNGAKFTSNTNTFEINGLTITAMSEASNITITTSDDTDGIYDMVKDFLKEYNALINEMDKLYNADSAKGYEPLTDEEKEAMSEKDIEKWEEKIKNSLLRRDSTLSSVSGAMKQVMMQGVNIGGKQIYLSEFGINTLGYFSAADNEKNAYHIDGDPDDSNTNTNADKLKTAIANDPDKVIEFFSQLSKNLYEKIGDLMKKTDYSSSFTLYDDVAMKEEYKDYTTKIKNQEQKITDFEDRYYKKFSAMETALAKMQSKESAISGLLGM